MRIKNLLSTVFDVFYFFLSALCFIIAFFYFYDHIGINLLICLFFGVILIYFLYFFYKKISSFIDDK